MTVLKFTWKEIKKHKTRTILITSIVALMISVPTVYYNLVATINITEENSYKQENVAEIEIYTMGRNFNSTTEEMLIEQVQNIEIFERRIFIEGIGLNEEKNARVTLEGVPDNFSLNKFVLPDESLTLNSNQCFVEETGASYLGLKEDEQLSVFSENGSFELEIVSLVKATWAVSHSVPRNIFVFVPLEYLQSKLNMSDEFNGIRIKVDDITQVYETLNEITDLLENNGWEVVGQVSISGGIRSQISIIGAIFLIIGYPILLIGVAIITTILIQQSSQKYRETAVMKAIGFSKKQVILHYFYQVIIWSFFGGLAGILIALAIHFIVVKFFIYPILGKVIFAIDFKGMAINFLLTVSLLGLFSMIPALKAYKLATMEALQIGFGNKEMKEKKGKSKKKVSSLSSLFLYSMRYLVRKKKQVVALVLGIGIATSAAATIVFVSNQLVGTIKDSFQEANQYDGLIFTSKLVNQENISSLADKPYIQKMEGYLWTYAVRGETNITLDNKKLELNDTILLVGTTKERELYVPRIVKGRLPNEGEKAIVISQKFAKLENLKVNETITISSKLDLKWKFEEELLICGIASTVMQNSMTFLVDIDFLADKINSTQNPYNTLAVTFTQEESKSESLEKLLLQLENEEIGVKQAFLKQVIYEGLSQIMDTFSLMLNIFSILTVVALAVGIFNFVLHNINERKREFALLNAIGGTKTDVMKILLYELMFLITIVSFISIVLTFLGEILLQKTINNISIPFWLEINFGFNEVQFVIFLPLAVYLIAIAIAKSNILQIKTVEILKETYIF
ncbi:MAG: ABC transporter permease [Candidatus Heimdallarchaeum endolithica]|uniref:ABC transporter permease n=1 Tax=Candidatus Heimdallarchaeum endolithica TaxID=2876572 RepID=A0A9Y1FP37_9ARCH|nr:MAG: ABC transporter permease [Candidatus Heimdallarchaeum endolithica]